MPTANEQRALVRIVHEWAASHDVRMDLLGQGWIIRLSRPPTVRFIHGYTFDLNPAAACTVANDKAATTEVLTCEGVPCVEHRLFLHPNLAKFVPHPGNWKDMLALFESWRCDVVVKDNQGTGGRDVFRARTPVELEDAVLTLFSRGRHVALSPFLEIERETRLVILHGRCLLAYDKIRPSVEGDARSSTLALIARELERAGESRHRQRVLESLSDSGTNLARIPAKGERVTLNWRHNLGLGSRACLLPLGDPALEPLLSLATHAARATNLAFGSVDIVHIGSEARVLELNAGVMMEALAESEQGFSLARQIYSLALDTMFGT
jgi:glutathione synthase/RimK-type ligase-like ATP-grasp enzyme